MGRRESAPRRSGCSVECFSQPPLDISVEFIRISNLEMVHPVLSSGMGHLFEAARRVVAAERDRQHDLRARRGEILARKP